MIICLGHAALDRIYRIAGFPPSPQKVLANSTEEVGGGMAANAAVAIARLGGHVALCSRIGDDLAGQAIRAELQEEGVDVSLLRAFTGARSSTSAVIVDPAGERLLVNDRGAGLDDDPSWLDLTIVQRASLVMADVRWPDGAIALFRAARQTGVTTVLDGDIGAASRLPALLALSDYAVFSAPGLAEFVADEPAAALATIRRMGPGHAGVTQGAAGYLWLDDTGLHTQAAFPVTAVDTSGAGDAFHGGFAWALAQGMDAAACARVGQATAALKCLTPGNRRGLPDHAALMAFLGRAGR
jgi:sulfofructose kinase